jgi:hypothetical protein
MYVAKNYRLLGFIGMISFFGVIGCAERTSSKNVSLSTKNQLKQVFKIEHVFADNKFDGARLNGFVQPNDSTYQAQIFPENVPVNNSPWYAFRIWSNKDTTVNLEIAYSEDFQNRYIPKISPDGISWKPLNQKLFEIDSSRRTIKMELSLTPNKSWISAQEVIGSKQISNWLDSLATSENIKREKIGESVLGRPIDLVTIDEKKSQKSILLIARQHPPEVPGGTISLMAFVQTILSNSDLATQFRKDFKIYIFPLLNPDGVDLGNWRHNANGVDLNRDWSSFSQPETKTVRDWFHNERQNNPNQRYCFGIDFHTSYSGPYLLTLDTIPHEVKSDITSKWIDAIEHVKNETLDIRPRSQSLPYSYNWMINEVGMEAVTYEEGDEVDRKIVKNRAEIYANSLMRILMDKYD